MGPVRSNLLFLIIWSVRLIQGLPVKVKIFTRSVVSRCEKQKILKIGNEISGKDNKDNCKRKEIKEAVFMAWFTIEVIVKLFISHASKVILI